LEWVGLRLAQAREERRTTVIGLSRCLAVTGALVGVVAVAGCGSSGSSSSGSSSAGSGASSSSAAAATTGSAGGSSTAPASGASTSSGGGKGKKVAIILTRPQSSAFGVPATKAAVQIKAMGNDVTVQGGVSEANVATTLQGYAARGYALVLVDGAEMQQQAQQVAATQPKTEFVVINGNAAKAPNLASATYSWEQSGFLAGITAGLVTKTNKVSTMSSIKIPPIEGLYYGFQQGVKAVNPKASTVNSYMATNVPDTGLAANLTAAQASRGNDVVFTVATAADPGVFRAAQQKGIHVIGYGTDETNLGPKQILTSTLVDYEGTMVHMTQLFDSGQLKPQVYTYGFKDKAFSLAPLTNMPAAVAAKIKTDAAKALAGGYPIKVLGGGA
jgi:basic membrane protein A and related proteins